MSKVQLEPYDVLQIASGGEWQDFATLRTAAEFDYAIVVVDRGEWRGVQKKFRIVNMTKTIVKYPEPLKVGDSVLAPGEQEPTVILAITEVSGSPFAECERASYPLNELRKAE